MDIKISKDLALPTKAVTSKVAELEKLQAASKPTFDQILEQLKSYSEPVFYRKSIPALKQPDRVYAGADFGKTPAKTFFLNEQHELPRGKKNGHTKRVAEPVEGQRISGKMVTILEVLAAYHPETLTRADLALRACMAQSGTFATYLSTLFSAGLIEKGHNAINITDAGLAWVAKHSGKVEKPTTDGLVAEWQTKFTGKMKDMFLVLVEKRGEAITRTELAQLSGMEESGTFATYLSTLSSSGVAEKGHGIVSAPKALFS